MQMTEGENTVCGRHDVTGDPAALSYKWYSQSLKTICVLQNTPCPCYNTSIAGSGKHSSTPTWPLHFKGSQSQRTIDNRPNINIDSFVISK